MLHARFVHSMPGTPELRATPVARREAGHEITLSFTRTARVQLYRMTAFVALFALSCMQIALSVLKCLCLR